MGSGRKLADGTIAQGVGVLTTDGLIAHRAPIFQQDLIDSATGYYPACCAEKCSGVAPMWTTRFAPQQMRIVSTSTQDGPAGTGARTVSLRYLDADYVERQEIVALNGTTPVNTVATNILRINGLHVQSLGTAGGQTVGNVSVTNLAGTVTYSYMLAGGNSARQAVYTVPAGGSTAEHYTRFVLSATMRDGVVIPDVFLVLGEVVLQNGCFSATLPTPIRLPEKTDVRVLTVSDAASANVNAAASFGGWFEPN